MMLDESALFLM